MQETWQKAAESSLPRLLLLFTATTVLPGQLSAAWQHLEDFGWSLLASEPA